jgi:hypothetical protein
MGSKDSDATAHRYYEPNLNGNAHKQDSPPTCAKPGHMSDLSTDRVGNQRSDVFEIQPVEAETPYRV